MLTPAVREGLRAGLPTGVALFPAFFLALLLEEVHGSRRRSVVALAGGLTALALTPVAPAGIPVLAAGTAALLGLRGR